jgi:3-hydroxyisobutyrate dehydrogenase-like beta-hydroxyacid dehydrogenase
LGGRGDRHGDQDRARRERDREEDSYVWSRNQAALLRERRFDQLDLANLTDQVENLGGAPERSIRSCGRTIVWAGLWRCGRMRKNACVRKREVTEKRGIGFVGLGQMGGPMTRRLRAAGHALVVHDVRAEAMKALVAEGAEAAGSPAEVAARAEVVLVSLPMPEAVRAVALGADGLIHGRALRTYVDLSTTGQAVAVEVADALGERGIVTLDAPVSGGVRGAVEGTLAVMAAGPAPELERVRNLLEVFGRVFHVGGRPGLGQLMKLANNFLSATAIVATAEAVTLGVKGGLDPATMLDVINASTGRNTASEDKFPRQVLTGRYAAGFTTGLLTKDLGLCAAAAEALGVPMPVAAEVHAQWQRAVAEQGANADITTIVRCVERAAGTRIAPARPTGRSEVETS